MSGSLPTRTMSPSRLWRYASIAFAVDVERCLMLVTPRLVRSLRVPWIEMKETSAIGATPTMRRAVRTFCQNRTRGRRIRSPAPRAHLVLTRARLERIVGAQGHPAQSWHGARSYLKGPSTRSGALPPAPAESHPSYAKGLKLPEHYGTCHTHVEDKWPQGRSRSSSATGASALSRRRTARTSSSTGRRWKATHLTRCARGNRCPTRRAWIPAAASRKRRKLPQLDGASP